ncbi:hypothetical protein H1C71_004214, partial [Ictidomys tridecemlineatus]
AGGVPLQDRRKKQIALRLVGEGSRAGVLPAWGQSQQRHPEGLHFAFPHLKTSSHCTPLPSSQGVQNGKQQRGEQSRKQRHIHMCESQECYKPKSPGTGEGGGPGGASLSKTRTVYLGVRGRRNRA